MPQRWMYLTCFICKTNITWVYIAFPFVTRKKASVYTVSSRQFGVIPHMVPCPRCRWRRNNKQSILLEGRNSGFHYNSIRNIFQGKMSASCNYCSFILGRNILLLLISINDLLAARVTVNCPQLVASDSVQSMFEQLDRKFVGMTAFICQVTWLLVGDAFVMSPVSRVLYCKWWTSLSSHQHRRVFACNGTLRTTWVTGPWELRTLIQHSFTHQKSKICGMVVWKGLLLDKFNRTHKNGE